MLIMAARVIRIICAVTTSVSVNAGRKQTYNFSSSGVDDEMFDIDGNDPDNARKYMRIYPTKNSGIEIADSAVAFAIRSK